MISILTGDCREVLRTLPDASVNCCVTSPPYFGLRDYDHGEQMGLESTPDEYVAGMVAVFREVRRVLRDDGTLWLNIGDSYAGSGRGGYAGGKSTLQGSTEGQDNSRLARGSQKHAGFHERARQGGAVGRGWVPPPPGLKQKNLIGIPWRLAFALQADGWILRQDIIWSKPNPMPESVRDRCTKAHEYLFLLSKGPRYHYDAAAIAQPVTASTIARLGQPTLANQAGSDRVPGKTNGPMKAKPPRFGGSKYGDDDRPESNTKSGNAYDGNGGMANKRSVWTVSTKSFKGAHFATFPPDLIEPCVLAGCPVGGTVIDPFGGAGTTGLVSRNLGRSCTLIEINPTYVAMAEARLMPAVDSSDW